MHALHEFDDDGSGASERKYRSEPVPPEGTKVAGLYQVVAGSFFDVMVGCWGLHSSTFQLKLSRF